jgi:hypothetical protein
MPITDSLSLSTLYFTAILLSLFPISDALYLWYSINYLSIALFFPLFLSVSEVAVISTSVNSTHIPGVCCKDRLLSISLNFIYLSVQNFCPLPWTYQFS